MSQVPVKWVDSALMASSKGKYCNVPVVELAALREVVEGLRKLRDDMLILQMDGCECNSCKYYRLIQHLLTQLREET